MVYKTKQNKNTELIDAENRLSVARGRDEVEDGRKE